MVKWFSGSTFQFENRKGDLSWATEEEEICSALVYILKLKADDFIKKNGKRAMIFTILSVVFTLGAVGAFIGYFIAGIIVISIDVGFIITAIVFARRKPDFRVKNLSKFYWPIGIVKSKNGHTMFDTLGIVRRKSMKQYAYQLTNILKMSEELKTITPTSVKANKDILVRLDGLVYPILARKELEYMVPLIDVDEDDNDFYPIFYGENSYSACCLREAQPSLLLPFIYTLEEGEELIKKFSKFDKYDNLILDTIQQTRLNIVDTIIPFKLKYFEEMEERKMILRYYLDLLENCKEEINVTFEPVRNLLLKNYAPNKVIMDAISSINTAQLEMGNFLYMEQMKLNKAESTVNAIAREQKEADMVFKSIGEIRIQINSLVKNFESTIAKIRKEKQKIARLEEEESKLKSGKKILERKLRRADDDAKYAIKSDLENVEHDLESTQRQLRNAKDNLSTFEIDANKLTTETSNLERKKKNFFEEQKKKKAERARSREKLLKSSKESEYSIASKAQQLGKSSDDLIASKLQSLRKLIANVDVSFENIRDRIDWLMNSGYYGEFLRNIDPLISRYYYLLTQNALLSNVLADYEYDAKYRFNYRNSFYRGEELQIPNAVILETSFMLIPIWFLTIKTKTGQFIDYWFSIKRFSVDQNPKTFTNDLPIRISDPNIIPSNLVNAFKNSKVYEQETENLNLLKMGKYRKMIKSNIDRLKSRKLISGRIKTITKGMMM
ncbi:MAG: hypothetical protein GPJ51_07040 [Candidatus Heimdallarchaeota archaeon]|nr:hypothetical protein [Candidatus Heimdallarchaeota archaeon]